jgi:AraC-like DNA-binding protein
LITYKYSRFTDKDDFPIGVKFMPVGTTVEMEFHQHEFSELAIISQGTATHKIAQDSLPLKKGDVLVVHPGCVHTYDKGKDMEMFNIIYDAHMPLPSLESCGLPLVSKLFPNQYPDSKDNLAPIVHLPEDDIEPIHELARRLDYECRHFRPGKQVLTLAIFMELIVYLARCDSRNSPAKKFHFALNEVVNYIDQHYPGKITVADLQKVAKMSERNLFRHFRNAFGVSPNEYLRHVRIQHATELLLDTDKQISNIALECGFYDSNHFSKIFKRILGSTPKKFRQQKRYAP